MSGLTIDDLKVRNEMRDSVMELIGKIIDKQLNGILEGVKEMVLEKNAEIERLTALVEQKNDFVLVPKKVLKTVLKECYPSADPRRDSAIAPLFQYLDESPTQQEGE